MTHLKEFIRRNYKAVLLAAMLSIVTLLFFYPMKQLPGPVYGGDVYYHYGVVKHIYDGNSPMENSQFSGEGAHYPWLMHLVVAYFAKATGLYPMRAALYFSAIITFLSCLVGWALARKIFGNEPLSLMFAAVLSSGFIIPMLTASSFTILVVFPLFALVAFNYADKYKGILVGAALGIVALSHIAGFVAACLLVVLHSCYRLLIKESTAKKEIVRLAIIFGIGVAIAMLYWGPPIFRYHLSTPNRWSSYVAAGEKIGLNDVFNKVKTTFFNLNNVRSAIISLAALFGLVVLLFKLKKEKTLTLPLLLLITAFIGFAHPILTLPLLGVSIGSYGFDVVFMLVIPLLIFSLFYMVLPSQGPTTGVKEGLSTSDKPTLRYYGVLLLAGLFTLYAVYGAYSTFDKDIWTDAGRQDSALLKDLVTASTVLDKLPSGTILPISEESGFAINSISGKKVVFARRTHTSPFVDANERAADAAVMLFGNDTSVKEHLFKKYGVKYLYADQYGLQQLSQCYQTWPQLNGDLSFSCLRTSENFTSYLTANGIVWKHVTARLDPASIVAPVFDIIAIRPNPIELQTSPLLTTQQLQIAEVKP